MARNVSVTVGSLGSTLTASPTDSIGVTDTAETVAFPVDPATTPGQQPVGQTGYTLSFSDEFTGSSLDTAKWDTAYPDWPRFNAQSPGGRFTNTDNANVYASDHVAVSGGLCTLTCEDTETVSGLPYTSGMLSSYPVFTQQYGYFETRCRITSVPTGIWPASWMSCSDYDDWPPEIDYFENFWQTNTYENNVYLPGGGLVHHATPSADVTAFQVYGCKWTPSGVWFYLNGTQTSTTSSSPATEQYLIVNLAAREPASPVFTSATMEIDYVRAWV